MLELESEGDQLERSFHSYLQRHQERNQLLNKDAKKIWQNYEIGKKLLSTNQPTKNKINSLNIVPAAVPVTDVRTHSDESGHNKFDFDREIDDGFNNHFENPYRIYDFALRSREYPITLQKVSQLKQSDTDNASSLPNELESKNKQNIETKDYAPVPKLDTHSFPPSASQELNETLNSKQITQLATENFTSEPTDQVDKLTVSQIKPKNEKDIVSSDTNVMSKISPVVDINLDNIIPITTKLEDTPVTYILLSEDELRHMEAQKVSKPLISSYKKPETDVEPIPVQSMSSIINIKSANQNIPAEISSAESDVQISVGKKSSSSEDFWN